ncbi:MAG: prepilin-type N-terminal cleavage/methylation domain-containing protein [Candidatus Omnitrophica bacterium]|nr:prepilin-type N-terminal cleavage/methylation domain-containing protein [Candidatus Omnitrophota bacterium]
MLLKKLFNQNKSNVQLKKQAGFTILEIMFSTAIFMVVVGGLFSLLIVQNDFLKISMGKCDITGMAKKVIWSMVKEIRFSNVNNTQIFSAPIDEPGVTAVSSNGRSIVFQVPVDWDADDDYVDIYNCTEWGADGGLNWSVEYCWDSTTNQVLRRIWDDSNTMVSQISVASDIALFSIDGYAYSSVSKKYIISSGYEIVEISIEAQKDNVGGRTLASPLKLALKNRVYFRN